MRPNGDVFHSPNRGSPLKETGHFFNLNSKTLSHRETLLPEDSDGLAEGRNKIASSYDLLASAKEKRHDFSNILGSKASDIIDRKSGSPLINETYQKNEENLNERMNISKKLEILIDKVSEFNADAEYSKHMITDDLQWIEERRLDIPDSFKSEISAYINSGSTSALRLQRGISGYHGCLWYIVNNRLLVWFFDQNLTVEQTFLEPIQDVEFTCIPPPPGITGIPQCVVVASLQGELCFRTISLINDNLEMVNQQKSIAGQFDGIFYERKTGRLFVMNCDCDYLQEVMFAQNGEYWLNNVFSSGNLFTKSILRSTRAEVSNPLTRIKDSFFTKPFNYRKHTFAYDTDKKLLYKLQSNWKGINGFEDKIVSQKVVVYNLEGLKFDCWGELKVENILQTSTTNKNAAKVASIALREAKQNKIVGLCAGVGEPWNLNVMYDNGFQIRLNVLISTDKKNFSCLLQEFIGRTVDTETKTYDNLNGNFQNEDATEILSTGPKITKTYVGFPSIQGIVHKQASDNMLTISIENKLSKVPAAKRFDPVSCHIYPADKAHTSTLSTILRVN